MTNSNFNFRAGDKEKTVILGLVDGAGRVLRTEDVLEGLGELVESLVESGIAPGVIVEEVKTALAHAEMADEDDEDEPKPTPKRQKKAPAKK